MAKGKPLVSKYFHSEQDASGAAGYFQYRTNIAMTFFRLERENLYSFFYSDPALLGKVLKECLVAKLFVIELRGNSLQKHAQKFRKARKRFLLALNSLLIKIY